MTYLANFLEHYKGNEREAVGALLKSLRQEKGIILKLEAVPKIFPIKGFEEAHALVLHAARDEGIEHPEELIELMHRSAIAVDYSSIRKIPEIWGKHVDFKKTMRNLHSAGKFSADSMAPDQIQKYFSHLEKHAFHLEGNSLDSLVPQSYLDRITPLQGAEIVGNFELFVVVCSPNWSDAHPSHLRVKFDGIWYDDPGRKMESRITKKNNAMISHGICQECYGKRIKTI